MAVAAAAAAMVEGAVGRALLAAGAPAPAPGAHGGAPVGVKAQLFCDLQSPTYDHPVDDVS
jgi:hypothetical protein